MCLRTPKSIPHQFAMVRGENTYRTTSAAKIEIDDNSFVSPDFDRSPEITRSN
jgi:hypothetical protein